ncbi:MAG: TIGR00725 family protein [Frankiales bacterium]|nr:TIGR00725 family protein [Frankiales bacterium]
MAPRYVAAVGPSAASASELEHARAVGRLLAEAGCVVVTGGGDGVMGAAATGATAAGGTAVGLLPGLDREAGHPAHTVLVATGLGELRNGLVVRAADAVIAVGGSWGTASEIALAVRTGVPVVVLAGWPLPGAPAPDPAAAPVAATTPEDAVAQALDRARRSG